MIQNEINILLSQQSHQPRHRNLGIHIGVCKESVSLSAAAVLCGVALMSVGGIGFPWVH